MAADRLRDSMLPNAFSNVLSDFADLFQKELQLAKAEFSSKLTTKLRGGVWMLAASALFLLAGAIFSEALVIWITTFGIALHMACLIVAGSAPCFGIGCIRRRSWRRYRGPHAHPKHSSHQRRHPNNEGATVMTSYSTRSAGAGWLTDTITRNPEGLLLLAAGCALLMRKAATARVKEGRDFERGHRREENGYGEWKVLATRVEASGKP